MKNFCLILVFTLCLLGCKPKSKYPENFTNKLPFGLEYYISENKANSIFDSLVDARILIKNSYDNSFDYKFKALTDSIIMSVSARFYNDSLYYVDIRKASVFGSNSINSKHYENALEFFKSQSIGLGLFTESYDKQWKRYQWKNQNELITFYPGDWFILIFEDGVLSEKISKSSSDLLLKEARERSDKTNGVKVENNSWDGSVSQVKKHLKANLKDPNSYESIEWSDVIETSNGYTVRHKYRAKNSYGGYVIENNIFYLDFTGNVVDVQ